MTKRIRIRYHRNDPTALVDAVDSALGEEWPELRVVLSDDGPLAVWRVEVPDDHGHEDCEGDEYTPHALATAIEGIIAAAAYEAGHGNPL